MPHYCDDCRFILDVETGGHRVGIDPCPRCGSSRVGATATPAAATATAVVHQPGITSRLDWQGVWLGIARDAVERARDARARVATHPSEALRSEFDAGLSAIGAAAFAVEAAKIKVFGDGHVPAKSPPSTPKPWTVGDWTAQLLVERGAISSHDATRLRQLFRLRHDSVHPRAVEIPLEWHPAGTNTSPELVAYRVEVAEDLVDVASNVVVALDSQPEAR